MKPNMNIFRQRGRIPHITGVIVLTLLLAITALPLVNAAPPTQANVLRLGYLGPNTAETARGAQLAINQINTIGGITAPDGNTYRMELVTTGRVPTIESLSEDLDFLVGKTNLRLQRQCSDQFPPCPSSLLLLLLTGFSGL